MSFSGPLGQGSGKVTEAEKSALPQPTAVATPHAAGDPTDVSGPAPRPAVPNPNRPAPGPTNRWTLIRRLAGICALIGALTLFVQQIAHHILRPLSMTRRGVPVDGVFRGVQPHGGDATDAHQILVFEILAADRPKVPRLIGDKLEIAWYGQTPATWQPGQSRVRLYVDPVLGAQEAIVDPEAARPDVATTDVRELTLGMLLLATSIGLLFHRRRAPLPAGH